MIGTRLPDNSGWSSRTPYGAFWREGGIWLAVTPNGLIANLRNHTVTEETDGTITVSPSILVDRDKPVSWHGYLERGVWRSC